MKFWNKTKIVATIGPASSSKVELKALIQAGVDLIRINGAHGSFDEHEMIISRARSVANSLGVTVGVLLDLPGPKIRLGELKLESIILKKGQTVTLACGKSKQKADEIPVPDKFIARAVKKGSQIFINDGIVEVKVLSISGSDIQCKVVAGGEIRSRKGLNLPRVKLPIPSLTKKDKGLLSFAIKQDVDYLGLSFVRSAKNVKDLKGILKKKAPHIGVIAKIEKPEALDEIDEIIAVSDAVMVARGDLGIEMPFDKIPLIQRRILHLCRMTGTPTITATQMMESMVHSARPTRAEASDIAMAVWEGTDAVMLSEETSIGQNPAKAVQAMARIAEEAEEEMSDRITPERKSDANELQAQVMSFAAGVLADELGAKAVVTPTRTGKSALFVSSTRPCTQVIAPTENEQTARRMTLYWGVRPIKMPHFNTVDELLRYAENMALKSKFIKKGDKIVITSGAHGREDDILRLVEVRDV
ncbi:MAG: pyruvate kinase [Deltaproteobacteria bacterium]|jgi:pyruvate kinase|nr:pyruvate kinase [Deltaproteobacteria bacterium]